ncbi:hypothetical protein [Lysinibacillus sp. RC79]|uniref:hypothetical protein n=1 Tax=Lysinibacillus sp. RC79 TaxID=3156296 RepID=UPI0035113324
MKKSVISVFFGVVFMLILGFNHEVEAAENGLTLTDSEKEYLYGLDFSETEVENIPYEEAKFLIENEAEVLTSFQEFYSFEEDSNSLSEITSFGSIPSADLNFSGQILKLKDSSESGYNAFYAIGSFRWLNKPIWALTDKITIGFPSSLGVYMPADKSGKLKGFNSTYALYNTSTGGTIQMSSSTTPSTWDPSGGVAGAYDLSGTINKFQTHEGTISQTFYIKSSSSGKATVKFEYGHKKITGTVGISVLPSVGLSISPDQNNIDIRSYGASFNY